MRLYQATELVVVSEAVVSKLPENTCVAYYSIPATISVSNVLYMMQYMYRPFQNKSIYTVNYEIVLLSKVKKRLF